MLEVDRPYLEWCVSSKASFLPRTKEYIKKYLDGTRPNKTNFPQRNRIISGLAEAVLVVEAGEKSGAIITANYALEQGKDVFAIPGDITRKTSLGTNKLIQDGAMIALNVEDIII